MKEKSEKEIRFETKLDELEKKEKATRKENKVKYGPGRRGTLVLVTASLCVVIAGLGVYYVQQLLKDDKYSSGNEVVTTVATTTTAASVSTGGSTTVPIEIYPDDADIVDNESSMSSDELLDGGFDYKPIEPPETSATTTVVPHDVQATTKSDDFFTGGMGGDYYFDDPADDDGVPASSTIGSMTDTRPDQTTANVATSVATTATVALTTSSAASTYPRPPVGTVKPVDPESTYGYNAHDYLN